MLYWHWLLAGIVVICLELLTPGFYFLWIGLAALVAGGVNYVFPELGFIYIGIIFAVFSIVFCYLGKVSLYKKVNDDSSSTLNRRGAQYIGKKVVVFEEVINGSGKVKLGDSVWSVKSDRNIKVGETVEILELDGISFIVK